MFQYFVYYFATCVHRAHQVINIVGFSYNIGFSNLKYCVPLTAFMVPSVDVGFLDALQITIYSTRVTQGLYLLSSRLRPIAILFCQQSVAEEICRFFRFRSIKRKLRNAILFQIEQMDSNCNQYTWITLLKIKHVMIHCVL